FARQGSRHDSTCRMTVRTDARLLSGSGILLFAALLVGLTGPLARAQSGASLLVKPWETDQLVEGQTDGYLFEGGHTGNHEAGHDFRLFALESSGRVRIMPGNVASPRLGYDVTYLNAHTRYPGFAN